jgi:Protein of unknown function (DUF3667)
MHPPSDSSAAGQAGRACLDCGVVLLAGQKYCPRCGQRTDLARLTLRDIGREVVHAVVHTDRSAYALLRALCARPGYVAREYVRGRRRRHFGPFATLVVLIGISTLLTEFIGFQSITSDAPLNGLLNFLQRHVNLIVFAQLPLLSLACLGLFRADRFTYAEHTVLAAYAFCLRVILFIFIVLPIWYFFRPSAPFLGYLAGAIWSAYFGFAASQFYSGNRLISGLKGALAAALTLEASSMLISGLSAVYDALTQLQADAGIPAGIVS